MSTEADMADKLILYIGEKNVSSWSMRPFVALTEKGIPFEERTISLIKDKSRADRLAIGPTGRVPVLHHLVEGQAPLVIPDSLAIIEYLEEAFPPPGHKALWPSDRRTRARARWLAAAMHSGFAKLREGMSFNLCFLPEPPPAPPEALAEAHDVLRIWEGALKEKSDPGPFLCGAFGAVDAMYAPVVVRLTSFRVSTAEAPAAGAYMNAVLAHPSVQRWLDPARSLPPVRYD
jgi:glutathione S-transferase